MHDNVSAGGFSGTMQNKKEHTQKKERKGKQMTSQLAALQAKSYTIQLVG